MREPVTTSVQRTGDLLLKGAVSAVLREAFFRTRRFNEFQETLGISRSVLARTLKTLVAEGIMERRLYQSRPERYEYFLTESGLELYPVFLAMKEWGDKWLEPDSHDVTLTHSRCGQECQPFMACDKCGERVMARDMRYKVTAKSDSGGSSACEDRST